MDGFAPLLRLERGGAQARAVLARARSGRVVSVSPRATNILFDQTILIGMLPLGAAVHPFAVTADEARREMPEGALVERTNEGLQCNGWVWSGERMEVVSGELVPTATLAAVPTELLTAADQLGAPAALPMPVRAALARYETAGDVSGLRAIVGVGEGLTPSGDDALVGILAALSWCPDPSGTARAERRRLASYIRPQLRTQTTRLAAQLIEAALDGVYAEPLAQFLNPLGSTWGPTSAARLTRLAAMGHRSGRDLVCGLAAALRRHAG